MIKAHPVDTTEKLAPAFTYPDTRAMFAKEGFTKVADTGSKVRGAECVVMRLNGSLQFSPDCACTVQTGKVGLCPEGVWRNW